jgi:hypothetical protein
MAKTKCSSGKQFSYRTEHVGPSKEQSSVIHKLHSLISAQYAAPFTEPDYYSRAKRRETLKVNLCRCSNHYPSTLSKLLKSLDQ